MEVILKELLKAFILPVVIAGVGGYASYTYNQAKLKVDYANAVHAYLPQIQSSDIYEQQVALEILRPILTSEQMNAISAIIKANQKAIVEDAISKGENIDEKLARLATLVPEKAANLYNFSQAVSLENESSKLIEEGKIDEAVEKLKSIATIHSDFQGYSIIADEIEKLESSEPGRQIQATEPKTFIPITGRSARSHKIKGFLDKIDRKSKPTTKKQQD